MKILTAAAMREADRQTAQQLGLPGVVLMESAAMRLAELVLSLDFQPRRVVLIAGPGNNGGDALAAARLLRAAGTPLSLWTTVPLEAYRGDAGINARFLQACAFPLRCLAGAPRGEALDSFRADLEQAGLVVDGLLGTGLSRPVEGLAAAVIEAINDCAAPVLAVDIPSGVNADSGAVMGCAVRARWTVTFAFPKPGLLLYPGADYCGELFVGEINVPSFLVEREPMALTTAGWVREMLPLRQAEMHKGDAGRVLVVAGSTGMTGAAVLAARAALQGGAGLVYLAAPENLCPSLEARLLEVITLPLPETAPGVIGPAALPLILEQAGLCHVMAVGPGLAAAPETAALLAELLPQSPVPLVLDAGALSALTGRSEVLSQARQPLVITPHPGEMGRLAGLSTAVVQQSRLEAARRFAREWSCTLVLKGAHTVIGAPGGAVYINPTGGPALATAGTGDLLTGLIASLIAQGLAPTGAARAGAFIHGLAGDLLGPGRGHSAADVLAAFPRAFEYLEQPISGPSPYLKPVHPLSLYRDGSRDNFL